MKYLFALIVGFTLVPFAAQAQGLSCVAGNLVGAAFCSCNLQYSDYYGSLTAQSQITILMCDGTLKAPINVGTAGNFSYVPGNEDSKAKASSQAGLFCGNTCRL